MTHTTLDADMLKLTDELLAKYATSNLWTRRVCAGAQYDTDEVTRLIVREPLTAVTDRMCAYKGFVREH